MAFGAWGHRGRKEDMAARPAILTARMLSIRPQRKFCRSNT